MTGTSKRPVKSNVNHKTTHVSVLPASTGRSVVACLAGQLNDGGGGGTILLPA
jgi:hypothetical protein